MCRRTRCGSWHSGKILFRKKVSKKGYDAKVKPQSFEAASLVLFKNPARKNKFSPIWLGPYKVVRAKGKTNTVIRMRSKEKVIHKNLLKKYNNFTDGGIVSDN